MKKLTWDAVLKIVIAVASAVLGCTECTCDDSQIIRSLINKK